MVGLGVDDVQVRPPPVDYKTVPRKGIPPKGVEKRQQEGGRNMM